MGRQLKGIRYNPRKKRSGKQKTHTATLKGASNTSDTSSAYQKTPSRPPLHSSTNLNIPALHDRIATLERKKDDLIRTGKNERRVLKRRDESIAGLEVQVTEAHHRQVEAERIAEMERTRADSIEETLNMVREGLEAKCADLKRVRKENHAKSMQVKRMRGTMEREVKKVIEKSEILTWAVKEKGIIKDECRQLVRDLVSLNVGVEHVDEVIRVVAETLRVGIDGKFDVRSVGRITLEGLVASTVQVAEEIQEGESHTVSGDGTTIKNVNLDVKGVRILKSDGSIVDRTLGVHPSVNHTAETQLDGWRDRAMEMQEFHQEVYKDEKPTFDNRDIFIKSTGGNSDHSNDQKLLFRLWRGEKEVLGHEKRREQILFQLAPEVLLPRLVELSQKTVEVSGGTEEWDRLSDEEKMQKQKLAYIEFCRELGREKFESLTEEEKQAIQLFLRWKHGGVNMLQACLDAVPVKLMNRDNRRAAESGSSDAASQVASVSKGGGVKLTELTGAAFKNKDDKKGQQDTTKHFAEHELGISIDFPGTSTVRYASHGDAASELIFHRFFFIKLLEIVRDKKNEGRFTNLELNIYLGLHDIPTLTELCPVGNATNAPDLGPLHEKLKQFLKKIISNPDLLLSESATFESGCFDAQEWERPDAIEAVHGMTSDCPHIRPLLIAMFEGALETWDRFTEEFGEGGDIARASSEERKRVPLPCTNDRSEVGGLGRRRWSKRVRPNMTTHQHNARDCYKRNGTRKFIAGMSSTSRAGLRRVARQVDSSKLTKKQRVKQATYDLKVADNNNQKRDARREKAAAKDAEIASIQPILFVEAIGESLTVQIIDQQLKWHRKMGGDIPKGSSSWKKDRKLGLLTNLVEEHLKKVEVNSEHISEHELKGLDVNEGAGDILMESGETSDDNSDEE
ncbi:hypothetical protein K435DRAFT_858496 [Dendrothele bispora CBS 962.96]|uniref:Uncharacterized protein n=1 Tax=Dendrothele bispora (strain CBS 962.96) TaxID=1314807 RepID=A0A4S8M413_DENBC|nr:hypothetical protein K435DRAFT_858496 [Dendrothele bispora CBS 962.96]